MIVGILNIRGGGSIVKRNSISNMISYKKAHIFLFKNLNCWSLISMW